MARILVANACELIDGLADQQYLYHTVTKECVKLDTSDELWELCDGDGVQYLVSGERSEWAQDLLLAAAYRRPGDVVTMVKDPRVCDSLQLLQEYVLYHRCYTVGLSLPGGASADRWPVYGFAFRARGQRWWWSLASLVKRVLLPQRGGKHNNHAWRSLQERWCSWTRFAQKLGHMSLRMSLGRAHHDVGPLAAAEASKDLGRVLDVPTASTVAVVGIVARMAFATGPQGGCFKMASTNACRVLLSSLCQRASLQSLLFEAGGEPEVHDSGALQPASEVTLKLDVREGRVSLAPCVELHAAQGEASTMSWVEGLGDTIAVDRLFQAFWAAGKRGWPWFKQLAWMVGSALKNVLCRKEDALAVKPSCARVDVHLEFDGHCHSPHQRSRECVRYWLAGRAASKDLQVVSFGMDASRVGFKGRQNVAIVLGDNTAFWSPPQVP